MKRYILLFLVSILVFGCTNTKKSRSLKGGTPLKVLQYNVWGNGRVVPNGAGVIADMIAQMDADIVFLCEVRNQTLIDNIKDSLKKMGKIYYGDHLGYTAMILSKYPLTEVSTTYDDKESDFSTTTGFIAKSVVSIKEQRFALYSAHLDYKHVGCFLPRGYNGITWKKMDEPITDADEILAFNMKSHRDEELKVLLKDMAKEVAKGSLILFGGDLNEPSHMDWQANTKDLWDHNGVIANWGGSIQLHDAGYVDTYRAIYPNAATHPGFTWPSGNKAAKYSDLQWTEGKDGRDRIDFTYYRPDKRLVLTSAAVVGPKEDFVDGIILEKTEDTIIIPRSGVWTSDHKATYAEFVLLTK